MIAIVSAGFFAGIITSIVLLMFKTDNMFGVGTALVIADFPKFSWMVVMIPIWILVGIAALIQVVLSLIRCSCTYGS